MSGATVCANIFSVKIRSVRGNNRKNVFEVQASTRRLLFPLSKAEPAPTINDPIAELFVASREAFTYVLRMLQLGFRFAC